MNVIGLLICTLVALARHFDLQDGESPFSLAAIDFLLALIGMAFFISRIAGVK